MPEGTPFYLECRDCGRRVELPEDVEKPGWVKIHPLKDWTSPPLRCPACTALIDGDAGAQA
jgi:hypothetical protein